MREDSQLSIGKAVDGVSTDGTRETLVNKVQPGGSSRRRLSPDEGREIVRLYAETITLTSDIRARFGIGESYFYRILHQHGIPLRGRTFSSRQPGPQLALANHGRRSGSSSTGRPAASPPRAAASPTTPRASVTGPRTPTTGSATPQPGAARQQFRIQFQAERVVEARDIRDALRQAKSLGATEIMRVVREEQ
jgi:transposase-like protein